MIYHEAPRGQFPRFTVDRVEGCGAEVSPDGPADVASAEERSPIDQYKRWYENRHLVRTVIQDGEVHDELARTAWVFQRLLATRPTGLGAGKEAGDAD